MIEINNWSQLFETADTRKRQRLGWFLAPSGCDSRGYRLLMREGTKGIIALGVFQALCQVLATLPKDIRSRGKLVNSDGTGMEVADIREVTRMGLADLQQGMELLEKVGWISLENQQSATCLPPACQSSATRVPENSGFVKGEGEGEGQEEGEGEGEDNSPALPDLVSRQELCAMTIADRILDLAPQFAKPKQLTHVELHGISDSIAMFRSLEDEDWDLMKRYLGANHAQGAGFWVPQTRSKLIEAFTDVFAHAQRWESKGGKSRKPAASKVEIPESFREWFKNSGWTSVGISTAWMTESCRKEWEDSEAA